MTRIKRLVLAVATFALPFGAQAYEQESHALLTQDAFGVSDLGVTPYYANPALRTLGLNGHAPLGDGEKYFEYIGNILGFSPFPRKAQDYEKRAVKAANLEPRKNFPLLWLLYGSIREDDNPSEDPPTPRDVEYGISRPVHHFFDPYFDRPLQAPGLDRVDNDVHTNPDWGLGVRNAFANPNTEETPRRNHFTVLDARESMFRALTLKTFNGTQYTDISSAADSATKQQWRQAYWSTAFRALGDVLHLNQDMAQPQHTRNEPHSGKVCPSEGICPGGHTSIYEKYIKARTIGAPDFNSLAPFHQPVKISTPPLQVATYPIPAFARYTDYWSTGPGSQSLQGKGLADYSNRGFFTAAKNFGNSEYPRPSSALGDYTFRTFVPTGWDGKPLSDNTPVNMFYGSVRDEFQDASTPDVPLTTYGLWDQFLKSNSGPARHTLNRLNYDAMADLLLPRAVAYSAGLINFFFRGRLDIALPDEGVFALADHASDKGFAKVRAKVRNITSTFFDPDGTEQPQHLDGGDFFAVIRYHKDNQYAASMDTIVGAAPCTDSTAVINIAKLDASTNCRDGVEQIIVSKPILGRFLDANEEQLFEFDFSDTPIPYGMTDVVLQVVYRGPLGSEAQAVAVGTLDVSEPTYFTYQNASDYIHIGDRVYTRGDVDASLALLAAVRPQACVDYQQSPPHLRGSCFNPSALDLTVSFGDLAKPIAQVIGLPDRRFMRFVYLTVADENVDPPLPKKTASPRVKITAHPHVGPEKALLYQQGTCLPLDPFNIAPRHAQLTVLSESTVSYTLERLGKLRGVNGWLNVSCVINGDGAVSATPDDRDAAMSALVPFTDEVMPYAVTIMPEYLANLPLM